MRAAFMDVGGIRTRYLSEVRGNTGTPLLLLHAVGLAGDSWFRNIDALSEDRQVCAPDLLGHGLTDAVDLNGAPPYALTAQHMLNFVDELGWTKFGIVGSSFGASIACTMYLMRPSVVDRLVLVGTASAFSEGEELKAILSASRANAVPTMREASVEACRRRLANICFDDRVVPDELLLSQITAYADPSRVEYYERAISAMIDPRVNGSHDVARRLEEIQVPTMVIWGKEDQRGSLERHVHAADRIPEGQLVVLEECGHLPYLERPGKFNEVVSGFLSSPTG